MSSQCLKKDATMILPLALGAALVTGTALGGWAQQEIGAVPQGDRAVPAAIWGTVIERASNLPLAAEVSIVHNQAPHRQFFHSRAGRNGAFSAFSLPSGKTLILVRAEGFGPALREVELKAGEVLGPLNFYLQQAARLEGIVVDDTGHPVEGAVVRAVYPHSPGVLFGWQRSEVVTDSDGAFSMRGLAPGADFYLEATHERYAPAFSPQALRLVPGEEYEAVKLRLKSGSRVAGLIADSAGRPVADAEVLLLARQLPEDPTGGKSPGLRQQALRRTRTDALGRFEFKGLPAGARALVVRHVDWKDWKGRLSLGHQAESLDLRVTLKDSAKPR